MYPTSHSGTIAGYGIDSMAYLYLKGFVTTVQSGVATLVNGVGAAQTSAAKWKYVVAIGVTVAVAPLSELARVLGLREPLSAEQVS